MKTVLELASEVRGEINSLNIPHKQLAGIAGIAPATLSRRLNGKEDASFQWWFQLGRVVERMVMIEQMRKAERVQVLSGSVLLVREAIADYTVVN